MSSDTVNGIKKTKQNIVEEKVAAIDPYPFYFHPSILAGTLHCASPPEAALRGALKGLGYRATRSHCKPGSIKTDAPWSIIWHVMREWARQKAPVKESNITPNSPAHRILRIGQTVADNEADKDKEEKTMPEVVFDEQLGRITDRGKLVRYQMNPRENWGPQNRAKGK